jgi:hypothetical protein
MAGKESLDDVFVLAYLGRESYHLEPEFFDPHHLIVASTHWL